MSNLKDCVKTETKTNCDKTKLENIVNKLIEYKSIDKNNIFVIDKKSITEAKGNLTELNEDKNEATFSTLKKQMADIKDKFKDVPESV